MADKEYKAEGGIEIGASLTPMIGGIYLVTAEDVHIAEGKSLADYINAGGGGLGLPDYTEADDGKFLQLVGGSPAWVLIEDGNGVKY